MRYLLLLMVCITNPTYASLNDSTLATIIVELQPGQDLFFYKRDKFLYPVKDYSFYYAPQKEISSDTIKFIGSFPNIVLFQEVNRIIPIVIFEDDTLIVKKEKTGSLIFEGNRHSEWQFMIELVHIQKITEPYLHSIYFENSTIRDSLLLNTLKQQNDLLFEYSKIKHISPEFKKYLLKENTYHYLSSLLIHEKRSLKRNDLMSTIEIFKDYLLGDTLNQGSLFRYPALYSLAKYGCKCATGDFPTLDDFPVIFKFIESNFTGLNRTQLLFGLLYEQVGILKRYSLNENLFNVYISRFYSLSTDKDLTEYIQEITGDNRIAKPVIPEQVFLLDYFDKSISLNKLIAQMDSAKIVYMDLWASWCGPCRVEMPASMQLSADYKDKGVEFLYISLDENQASWRRAVDQIGLLKNESFIVLDDNKSMFLENIKVNEIPRYMLVDKRGKIILDNAPSPSDQNIRNLFDNLLKK
jgi:thiol-disulfide isomerase/thioredoxin